MSDSKKEGKKLLFESVEDENRDLLISPDNNEGEQIANTHKKKRRSSFGAGPAKTSPAQYVSGDIYENSNALNYLGEQESFPYFPDNELGYIQRSEYKQTPIANRRSLSHSSLASSVGSSVEIDQRRSSQNSLTRKEGMVPKKRGENGSLDSVPDSSSIPPQIQQKPFNVKEFYRHNPHKDKVKTTSSFYCSNNDSDEEILDAFDENAFTYKEHQSTRKSQIQRGHSVVNIFQQDSNGSQNKLYRKRSSHENLEPIATAPSALIYRSSENDFFSPDEEPRRAKTPQKERLARRNSIVNSNIVLDPDFDITPVHLMKLFNNLDSDHTGRISYAQMQQGLRYISKSFHDTVKVDLLHSLIEEIDVDNSHDITQAEFVTAVQEYTARALAQSGGYCECFVFDYGPEVAFCQWVDTSIPPPSIVKTGSVNKSSSVRDSIDGLSDDSSDDDVNNNVTTPLLSGVSPKTSMFSDDKNKTTNVIQDKYEGDSTTNANCLSMAAFQAQPTSLPKGVAVRWVALSGDDVSLFIRVCNKYKIHPLQMEDVLERKERPKVESFGDGNMHIVIGLVSLKVKDNQFYKVKVRQMNMFMIDGKTVVSFMKEHTDFYQAIMSRIMYSGSKLRLGDSRFLIYALVDSVVDRVYPIMKLFNTELKKLQGKIQSKDNTKLDTIKQIQQIYREVNVLHFWLRPIYNVVIRLLDELPADDKELRHHLEDLRDHVLMLLEQAVNLVTWARSLNDDYRNEQAHRMSEVMYVLTLVTTIFIPAQFLTGVFGMNFKYMPELEFRYSYLIFWVLVFMLSGSSFLIFKWKGWLKI